MDNPNSTPQENPQQPQPSDKVLENNVAGQQAAPETPPQDIAPEAKSWAMYCHLAGLGWLVIPLVGNIVAPLIFWQYKKDNYPFVDQHGKEAMNFQISMTIYFAVAIGLCFMCIGAFLLPAVAVVDLVLLIIAAVKAANGEMYKYPLTIRFIK